jgi:hypothetical protein
MHTTSTRNTILFGTAFTLFFILLSFSKANAQNCNPPVDVQLFIDEYNLFAYAEWFAPEEDCPFLYYELEYSYFNFTPGTGQGTLESPLYITGFLLPDYNIQYVYVRSVCDCLPFDGIGDGEADAESPWVPATVIFIPPPVFPDDGVFCEGAPNVPVDLTTDCGMSLSLLFFRAPFAFDDAQTFPCSNPDVYTLWRKFTAPPTGVITVNMFPSNENYGWNEDWENYGFVILEGACGSESLTCVPSFTPDLNIGISDLTPGQEYHIGFWNNDYPYFWDWEASYNGTINSLQICAVDNVTGIGEMQPLSFTVSPNPSNGNFQLKMSHALTEKSIVEFYNVNGQLVLHETLLNQSTDFDLTNLPKGMYIVKWINSNSVLTKKIILD